MLMNLGGDESRRIKALQALLAPDESRDEVLRKFVQLASQALGIPGSFISVLDDEHQFVRASRNFDLKESSRDDSLCRHVVDSDIPVVVPDTLHDPRFSTHPLIIGEPFIRFYAGVPLKNRERIVLGTLCVTDTRPHTFSTEQLATLKLLGELVMSFLEAWHAASFTDVVTGLPNRQRLIRDLQFLAAAGDTTLRRLVLIDCIDMPRAYELARSMGMLPVENLLKDMATLLPLRLRPGVDDRIYTVATGRFAILTGAKSRLSASYVATVLQGISADLEEGISVELTAYTGETAFMPGSFSAQEILRQGVSALHEAIGQGVSAMSFNESFDASRTEDFLLMNDLAVALEKNEGLYLVYQPKVCLQTGVPLGLEALIRWKHPTRGELSPAMFIPLASQTNLVSALTEWVINSVIAQQKAWRSTTIRLPVSVNVSEMDFAREGYADYLEDKMIKAGLPTALLGIECMETESILESPAALKGLEMLKQRGFALSLDDFGIGYSNISYLRRMPLDVIKLDKSLISELSSDTASRIIARSIIKMLKDLDYTVLAEGVENAEIVSTLRQYGCDQAQGFFYSKPLPVEELQSWLSWKLRDRLYG
ncbi:putative bifunctional diguanylate cyclase/phosphodiesterase [Erwinia oleae]|uniref:putative bifunctional diguanylate cyclase/phosphodiesterase n=1 Tax=Erwinia oleae TaxID=796334 RepID=UPI000554338F|nr:GGDEF and EAL domain-containing protein [Erwinia oleae]